jgi:hypothetical protein
MKILKQIRWALGKSKLEKNLSRYCAVEYRTVDQSWAFYKALDEHKLHYFGDK